MEEENLYNLYLVFIFNDTKKFSEMKIPADSIVQKDGWVFASYKNNIVGGAKEEHLKAFYLGVK